MLAKWGSGRKKVRSSSIVDGDRDPDAQWCSVHKHSGKATGPDSSSVSTHESVLITYHVPCTMQGFWGMW